MYKASFGLATLFLSGFGYSYYYNEKKQVLKNISFGTYNQCGHYGDYPEIPFYLKNNKEINNAMEKYKKDLIDLINRERMEMYQLDKKFKKDKDFILQLVKETKNVFYIKHIKKSFTGKEFNELLPDLELRKLVNGNMQHYGFKYQRGINIDTLKFNTDCECCEGELYFSNAQNISQYKQFGDDLYEIRIPDDALVYIESKSKAKATKIELVRKIDEECKRLCIDMQEGKKSEERKISEY